jgi:hypothetical protein
MTDYIKRIQSRLSRKEIKKTRTILIDAVAELGFDHANLTDDEVDILTNLLVEKFQVETPNNIEIVQTNIECADSENDSQLPIQQPDISDNLVDEPEVNEVFQTPKDEPLEIVLSPEQKQDLVASQASALSIELSEAEVIELATDIKDSFLDHDCFISEVITAIVSYNDHRADRLEQKIKAAREHIESRIRHLNQTLVGEFGEMNNFFRAQSAKRKELSKAIAAAFKT